MDAAHNIVPGVLALGNNAVVEVAHDMVVEPHDTRVEALDEVQYTLPHVHNCLDTYQDASMSCHVESIPASCGMETHFADAVLSDKTDGKYQAKQTLAAPVQLLHKNRHVQDRLLAYMAAAQQSGPSHDNHVAWSLHDSCEGQFGEE